MLKGFYPDFFTGQNEVTQIRGMGNDPWGSVEELDEDGLTKGLKQLSTENGIYILNLNTLIDMIYTERKGLYCDTFS